MESVSDMPSEQRAVIEGLFWGGGDESLTNINERLTNVFGDMAADKSTVSRWAKWLASSEQVQGTVSYLPCSGANQQLWRQQQADNHIWNDRRNTTRDLAAILSIGKGSFDKIIHQLGYSQACARCVPRSLTEERKEQR
jgi:hypothetical protein